MPQQSGRSVPPRFNKTCGIEDFEDPDLAALIREIFSDQAAAGGPGYPAGQEDRRQWETAMTVRAFRDHGLLRPDATALGVGDGTQRIAFHLTTKLGRVFATDPCVDQAESERETPVPTLIEPKRISPTRFDRTRLRVLQMDARLLGLPDASVDCVFCSGTIGRLGDWTSAASCAYEMGRVLKPGGILCLSAELLIAGAFSGAGVDGVLLFDPARLQRFVVEASGLEPVDPLDATVTERTLTTRRVFAAILERQPTSWRSLPDLVLTREGKVFTSVHMTLRKTASYPACDNRWARPAEDFRSTVHATADRSSDRLAQALDSAGAVAPRRAVSRSRTRNVGKARSSRQENLEAVFARWDSIRERSALTGPEPGLAVRRMIGFLKRTARRIRDLGVARDHDRELFRALLDYTKELERRLAKLEPPDSDSNDQLR
jgi:SAM-dependent methyltransferase